MKIEAEGGVDTCPPLQSSLEYFSDWTKCYECLSFYEQIDNTFILKNETYETTYILECDNHIFPFLYQTITSLEYTTQFILYCRILFS